MEIFYVRTAKRKKSLTARPKKFPDNFYTRKYNLKLAPTKKPKPQYLI